MNNGLKTLAGLLTAYVLLHNVNCENSTPRKEVVWNNEKVPIVMAKDSAKTVPNYTNYAVKIENSDISFEVINENNLYLRDRMTGTWVAFQEGYEKADRLLKNTSMYSQIGVLCRDTMYTVSDKNLLVGIDGIGGYYPAKQ